MIVNTGYGYVKDSDGRIISKYVLPIGEHPEREGFTYHEVADEEALNQIEVYTEPPVIDDTPTLEQRLKAVEDKVNVMDIEVKSLKTREVKEDDTSNGI